MARPIPARHWSDCADFEENPEILLLIDQVAKRYGRLPSEILALDVWDLSIAVACMMQHDATAGALMKRIQTEGMPVWPVVVLRD